MWEEENLQRLVRMQQLIFASLFLQAEPCPGAAWTSGASSCSSSIRADLFSSLGLHKPSPIILRQKNRVCAVMTE